MARSLSQPALRGDGTRPLGPDELVALRGRLADELVRAATARRVDVDEVRELGRVARLVDRRLATLAERARAPSARRRIELAVQADPTPRRT